ncbi:MAG: holin [Clostridia bacterium]|nr:holin [Clostridia bacterium]
MKYDITPIIEALIMLFSTIITIFIIPKISKILQEKLTAEQRENLGRWVKVAVDAAEQLYGSKTGLQKKEYVVNFLLSKGIVVDIDEVTALIESEVYKLTNEKSNKL